LQKLTSIPGVGAKTAARLVEHFGSEEEALEAIEGIDLHSLASSGIGMRSALSIVLSFQSRKVGASRDDVLRTDDARALFDEALELFKANVVNARARDRFDLYFPLPSSKVDVIGERLQLSKQAVQLLAGLSESDLAALDASLAQIQPIPRATGERVNRTILVESKEDYAKLLAMGVDKYCRIGLLEGEDLRSYLGSEEHLVLILKRSVYDLDIDAEFIEVFHEVPPQIKLLPETITQAFVRNIATIHALEGIAHLLEKFPRVPAMERIRSRMSLTALSPILEAIAEIGAEPSSQHGRDIRRLEATIFRIGQVLQESEMRVNSSIEDYLSSYEAKVSGEKIAELLREASSDNVSSGRLMGLIPREVIDKIYGIIHGAERSLRDALALGEGEQEWLEGIFSESALLPVEVSGEVADKLKLNLSRKLIWLRFKVLSDMAARLAPLVRAYRDCLSAAFELDALLAMGKVGSRRGFCVPKADAGRPGIWFRGATNTRLLSSSEANDIQRISYSIGPCPGSMGGSGERIVILTGANSGGKTMLLSTIAQLTMLGLAGLPVPATDATIFPVDEIYYFSKPLGVKDAGAFESALTSLVDVASSSAGKLVLVDEFEASTEPGAAARVLAAILEILGAQEKSLIVVVTHLAQQLMASMALPVRVDGIEAKGLDADYNLMVDRSPRINYLARSTPELIVERLLHRSDGPTKETYRRILDKIRGI
jgi:DNA mismatch repair protein MutS2